ncbi:hypothetical protein [Candidatus Palauibacter sp.]|uniref:hypothetical protein n=1 Tax=Candidatus Palauibacter sp. TaxID=3101350 RepID=UPI003B0230FC
MSRAEWQRTAYLAVLRALDEAIFRLEQVPVGGSDGHAAERQGTFRLGEAGGIAFAAHFPGADSGALFDDISDAVETEDLDRVRQVRSLVEARLRSSDADGGDSGGGTTSAEAALDWDAGYLQILAVLNETRKAREHADSHRYWVMTGFLAGLLHWNTRPGENEPGSLRDAVIAACNEGWGETLWQEWTAIREAWLAGESLGSPVDTDLLHRWLGLRLAAADEMTGTLFSGPVRRVVGGASEGELDERADFLRCERSTRRAQHFGRSSHRQDG